MITYLFFLLKTFSYKTILQLITCCTSKLTFFQQEIFLEIIWFLRSIQITVADDPTTMISSPDNKKKIQEQTINFNSSFTNHGNQYD